MSSEDCEQQEWHAQSKDGREPSREWLDDADEEEDGDRQARRSAGQAERLRPPATEGDASRCRLALQAAKHRARQVQCLVR